MRMSPLHVSALVVLLAALVAHPPAAVAREIWSGRTFEFNRPNDVDWTDPQYRDVITPNVALTRASTQGLYNIAQEPAFDLQSPTDTQWATGDAVNYASLVFQDWIVWAGHNPPGTVGVNAVVHLLTDDIYVDIRFTSWTARVGGGFTYVRAQSSPTPTSDGTWGRLKALYR